MDELRSKLIDPPFTAMVAACDCTVEDARAMRQSDETRDKVCVMMVVRVAPVIIHNLHPLPMWHFVAGSVMSLTPRGDDQFVLFSSHHFFERLINSSHALQARAMMVMVGFL